MTEPAELQPGARWRGKGEASGYALRVIGRNAAGALIVERTEVPDGLPDLYVGHTMPVMEDALRSIFDPEATASRTDDDVAHPQDGGGIDFTPVGVGRVLFTITAAGDVELGPEITWTEAAESFWAEVERLAPAGREVKR